MPNQTDLQQIYFCARFFSYFLIILAGTGSLTLLIHRYGMQILRENGAFEWVEFGIMAGIALLFLWLTLKDLSHAGLYVLFSGLAAFVCIRELDATLDKLLPGGWKVAGFLVLGLSWILAVRLRASFLAGSRWLLEHYVFVLLWAGFVVAVPFAQLLGHGPLMRAVMGEQYMSDVKRIVEESCELLGYLLLLFAAIETVICRRRSA